MCATLGDGDTEGEAVRVGGKGGVELSRRLAETACGHIIDAGRP